MVPSGQECPFSWRSLCTLTNKRWAARFWLPIRLYLGYVWFSSGWEKVTGQALELGSSPRSRNGGAWIGSERGRESVEHFIDAALACTPSSVPEWYAAFLKYIVRPHAGVFATLVAWGELFVGAGLLCGALTGIAAFFGVLMNACFLLAGARRSNLKLTTLGILIVGAHRVAGYYGLDRFMLPALQGSGITGTTSSRSMLLRLVTMLSNIGR